jgi:hypothetical protein
MGSTQPRECNWGATWKKKQRLRSRKTEIAAVGIRRVDHATPLYPQKLALTSPTNGSRSVGVITEPVWTRQQAELMVNKFK